MIAQHRTRILVVDDSAVVRRAITEALSKDPALEVVGTACDPYVARDKILELKPDVLTLDIEMPRMDGLSFLRVLRQHHPIPVVIISSLTQSGSSTALEALAAGAVDVIAKPSSAWGIGRVADELPERIKTAARAKIANCKPSVAAGTGVPNCPRLPSFHPHQLILIGASTGGTEAIKSVLTQLPEGLPGICIVQHIPPVFSKAFAERLNGCCPFEVREAIHGDEIRAGLALVAPGDFHMSVSLENGRLRVRLQQGPPLHHTRPAVDVLFHSAAQCVGRHAVAALLTGMGSDGAMGMQKLQSAGAVTMAQDEKTCVVYGMPRAAVELGAAGQVLPLGEIPEAILKAVQSKAVHPAQNSPPRQPSPASRTSTSLI